MNVKSILFSLIFLFVIEATFGQDGYSYEVGLNLGIASFQTDYGERYDFQSGVSGNIGMTSAATFYMNFFERRRLWNSRRTFFNSHFKLKGEISYMSARLDHFGRYVEGDSQSAQQLRAMHGTTSLINIGPTLEFHFYELYGYTMNRDGLFDPFIGVGTLLHYSDPTLVSDMGDYKTNPSVLIPKYRENAIFIDPKITGSVLISGGTRMKIGDYTDLIVDNRWQYFFTNKIDGLDPKHESNKYNDWLYSITFGVIYQLN